MDWLNQVFEERSIAWLLITTGVALVGGFLSHLLISCFVTRPEIIDQTTLQGKVRREVEDFLGERSAEREYNLQARERLYHAIGRCGSSWYLPVEMWLPALGIMVPVPNTA